MLAAEGVVTAAIGTGAGLALGAAISLVLIQVVNRQSFHWGMDIAMPWPQLAAFALGVVGSRRSPPWRAAQGDGRRRRACREGGLVRRRAFLAAPLALLSRAARANAYPAVVPGVALAFPRDHGSHPAFRTEWWYATGWVRTAAGRELGVQVTFFRNRPNVAERNASAFAPRQLLFAPRSRTDPCAVRWADQQGLGVGVE